MGDYDTVIADLERTRERTVDLIRAKLDAVAEQVQEAAARTVRELGVVLPADPEALFPMAMIRRRLDEVQPAEGAPTGGPSLGLEMVQALDSGRSQTEVLQELLQQLGSFAGPRAILVFRESQVSGWAGAGLSNGVDARTWRGDVADSESLSTVMSGRPVVLNGLDDQLLQSWSGIGSGRTILVPMSMRGKVVGVLLAQENDGPFEADAIQILTFLAGLLLETLSARPVVPTPAVAPFLELTAALAEPAPVPEPEVAPAPVEEEPQEEVAVSAPEAEAAEAPESSGEETVDAGTTVEVPVPAPAPVVRPRTPEDERKHEEARRFARLLVSEIRLYNEQAVQDGKQAGDVYQRLKEDIDRSKEMYEQRVVAEVRANSNYFFDELVRILADGDPDALGL